MMNAHPAVRRLQEKFPTSVLEVTTFRDEVNVTVQKKDIFEICRFLCSDADLQYQMLTDLCLLRKVYKQSPFTRIDSSTVFTEFEEFGSSILNRQININSRMFSFF